PSSLAHRRRPPQATLFPYTTLFRSEGFRELAKILNFDSIPSLTDRAANLPVPVVNPLTGKLYPANTPIPATETASFARKVLAERSEEHTSELQSLRHLVCRLLLEKQ